MDIHFYSFKGHLETDFFHFRSFERIREEPVALQGKTTVAEPPSEYIRWGKNLGNSFDYPRRSVSLLVGRTDGRKKGVRSILATFAGTVATVHAIADVTAAATATATVTTTATTTTTIVVSTLITYRVY